MGIVPAEFIQLDGDRYKNLFEIAHEYGILNYLYYSLIKTGFLPPIIFMGVGAAAIIGGVTLIVLSSGGDEDEVALMVSPSTEGAVLTLSGRF